MTVGSILGSSPLTYCSPFPRAFQRTSAPATSTAVPTDGLRSLLRTTVDLRDALGKLASAMRLGVGSASRDGEAASVSSAVALGLRTEPVAATLVPTAEVNTAPTSYTPFGPDWTRTSTSEVTVEGVYTGTADDTLTFKVKSSSSGDVGDQEFLVEMFDGAGTRLETVILPVVDPPDAEVMFSNGLTLTFSEGWLRRNDTLSVDVFASVPSSIRPDKPFDGVRNERPDFDAGLAVTTGSFTVNGETIEVAADDKVNSVVAKITASAAGVTASYDAAQDKVILTHQVPGPAGTIDLADDTSGFLAATKLAGATFNPGLAPEQETALADVAAFSGVSAGTLRVNGMDVAIDPVVDSLEDVLARIDASQLGVTASFDPVANRVTVSSTSNGVDLLLEDGGTNFFDEVGIAPGTFEGIAARKTGRPQLQTDTASRQLKRVGRLINRLFEESGSPAAAARGAALKREVTGTVGRVFEHFRQEDGSRGGAVGGEFGLAFRFGNSDGPVVRVDVDDFRRFAVGNAETLSDFFLENRPGSERDGLIPALRRVLRGHEQALRSDLGSVGNLLSHYA